MTAPEDLPAAVRKTGERIACRTEGGLRILSVCAVSNPGEGRLSAQVTFESLNNSLMQSTQLLVVSSPRELAGLLRTTASASRTRALLLRRLSAKGGVAVVDKLVEAAVQHVGSSVGSVVAKLRSKPGDIVDLGGAGAPILKAWLEDGRLVCTFELDPLLRWNSTRLVVRGELAATVADAIVGRSVSTIADHPMLPSNVRIVSFNLNDGQTEIRLSAATRIVHGRELSA